MDTSNPVNTGHEKLKLAWLGALSVLLFVLDQPAILFALLAVQLALWFGSGLPAAGLLGATRRLGVFFVLIALSFAFVSGGLPAEHWETLPIGISINVTGLFVAALMCLRVATLVIASAWLRQSCAPGALVRGLEHLGIPQGIAITVDATLAILGGQGGMGGGGGGRGMGAGTGGGGRRHRGGGEGPEADREVTWQDVRAGRVQIVSEILERSLGRARRWLSAQYPDMEPVRLRDLSIVLAICLAVIGLKVLQVLPGIPFASGHKNLLVVPMLLYVSRATHMRFGGLVAGTAVGIVSFLLGYGKYGVLEVFHFAMPGLIADLLLPLAQARARPARLAQFAVIGAIMGLGRFAANFLAIVLAGSPEVAYVLFAPMLISQVAFGTLSCFVSILIVPSPDHSAATPQADAAHRGGS